MTTRTFLGVGALLLLTTAAARAENTVWLSSLDLSKATQGFGQPQVNKSIDGHLLTLNGRTYLRGFGTHSPGILAVKLDGGATRFQATVGIDDEVGGGKGHAEFEALGDGGKMLWRSGIMHQGDPAKTLDLDLTGVKQLILRVTTGGTTYDFDHDDWADARFTVVGPQPQTVVWKPTDTTPVIWMGTPDAAPHINNPLIVGVYPGTPLLWTVPVSGTRPLVFSAKGLPKGLSINEAGTISGTAPKAGDYPVQVGVKNSAGRDERTVHVVVGPNLVRTPAMGWNSYDAYGSNVNEAETLANARYLLVNMQPYGWDTVVVDYRWYDPASATAPDNGAAGETLTMDNYGRLLAAPNRFPSGADGKGFKGLADTIHGLGLKFGIHIMRGIPRNAVKQ
ncbi:MAG: NPCBM/NEW2 domain-containing protein, partial [Armatimonadota bacterium]|nr:NPCBM/NEW2 domain-containing protein [Armatimonadota bacterium]